MTFNDVISCLRDNPDVRISHLDRTVPIGPMPPQMRAELVGQVRQQFEDEFRLECSRRNISILTVPEVRTLGGEYQPEVQIRVTAFTMPMLGGGQ